MSVSNLPIEERQAKLEALAGYDENTLQNTTLVKLRELVKGVITNYSKPNKPNLILNILDLTAKYRQEAQEAKQIAFAAAKETQEKLAELEAASLFPATREGHRDSLFPEGSKQAVEGIKKALTDVAADSTEQIVLTEKVSTIVIRYYCDQEKSYKATSRKSNVTDLNDALNLWVKNLPENIAADNIKLAVLIFQKQLKSQMETVYIELRASDKKDVKERTDYIGDLLNVESRPIIDHAIEVLKTLADYRDVAIALTVLTGRRMSEIMATLRIHGVDEDGKLLVSGLAKAKSNKEEAKNKVHDIPVLTEPELIIKALEYLENVCNNGDGCRLPNGEDVNDKYSKTFSRQMKKWEAVIGTKASFKSLRSLYAAICYKRFGEGRRKVNYLAEIMKHSENDLTTAGSYEVWNVTD